MMSDMFPKDCVEDIQKLQRDFVWGDTTKKRSFHVMNCEMVTKDKMSCRLVLRSLSSMNKASCMNQVGKIINEEDVLWCKVMCGKYSANNMMECISKASDSKLWKDIIKLKPEILKHVEWIIGMVKRLIYGPIVG